jgi:hypothetical protein
MASGTARPRVTNVNQASEKSQRHGRFPSTLSYSINEISCYTDSGICNLCKVLVVIEIGEGFTEFKIDQEQMRKWDCGQD